jgi:hypothetical protein
MFVSYVVRLRSAQLRRGSFAGEVVAVASGRRYGIASLEQLAAFLSRTCAEEEELGRHPVLTEEEPRLDAEDGRCLPR